ncbi:TPA: hypothetical protein ACGORE_000435 [Streptococcus suis]
MSVTLLKRLNLGLYSVAAFLIVMLFLPIGQWFDIVNVNFKLTFFIIPFFGLAVYQRLFTLKIFARYY